MRYHASRRSHLAIMSRDKPVFELDFVLLPEGVLLLQEQHNAGVVLFLDFKPTFGLLRALDRIAQEREIVCAEIGPLVCLLFAHTSPT